MPASGEVMGSVVADERVPWVRRLRRGGITLPVAPRSLGNYATASRMGEMLFLSGMLPLKGGQLAYEGRIGDGLRLEEGREAAALAALNGLAVACEFLDNPAELKRVVRVSLFLATARDFTGHAGVADGASHILTAAFPGSPAHTRLAIGAESLPLGAPVAVELILGLGD